MFNPPFLSVIEARPETPTRPPPPPPAVNADADADDDKVFDFKGFLERAATTGTVAFGRVGTLEDAPPPSPPVVVVVVDDDNVAAAAFGSDESSAIMLLATSAVLTTAEVVAAVMLSPLPLLSIIVSLSVTACNSGTPTIAASAPATSSSTDAATSMTSTLLDDSNFLFFLAEEASLSSSTICTFEDEELSVSNEKGLATLVDIASSLLAGMYIFHRSEYFLRFSSRACSRAPLVSREAINAATSS